MLPLLIFRQFLPQQVCQGVVEAVLLKVGPGDACGIVLRSQIIELPQFRAILALGDGGGVADLHRVRSRCQGRGGQRHGQAQHSGTQSQCSFHHSLPFSYFISSIPPILGPDRAFCSAWRSSMW